MKKLIYLLLCIVAFVTSMFFTSCEECGLDETEQVSPTGNVLVGTWKSAEQNEYLVICESGSAFEYNFNNEVASDIQKYSYTYNNGTLTMAEAKNPAKKTSMSIKSLTKDKLVVEDNNEGKTYNGVASGPCSIQYLEGNCSK